MPEDSTAIALQLHCNFHDGELSLCMQIVTIRQRENQ